MQCRAVGVLVTTLAALTCASCTHSINPGDQGFVTDFEKGHVYRLTKTCVLERDEPLDKLPDCFIVVDDRSVRAYLQDPKRYGAYLGILEPGIRIRCDDYLFCDCADGTAIHIVGNFLTGPFRGRRVIMPSVRDDDSWVHVDVDKKALEKES